MALDKIHLSARSGKEYSSDEDVEVKVVTPVNLRLSTCCSDEEKRLQLIGACWSRIAFLQRTGEQRSNCILHG